METLYTEVWVHAANTAPARIPNIIEHTPLRRLFRPTLFGVQIDNPHLGQPTETTQQLEDQEPHENV